MSYSKFTKNIVILKADWMYEGLFHLLTKTQVVCVVIFPKMKAMINHEV